MEVEINVILRMLGELAVFKHSLLRGVTDVSFLEAKDERLKVVNIDEVEELLSQLKKLKEEVTASSKRSTA